MNKQVFSSIKKHSYEASGWFENHAKKIPVPFLSAVTIKDSGFKLSVSDFQLFPSGLNHLSSSDLSKAPKLAKKYFKRFHEDLGKFKKILVLASTQHPNSLFYDHLDALIKLLKKSEMRVVVGTIENTSSPFEAKTSTKKSIQIFPTHVENYHLVTNNFKPEFVLVVDRFAPEDLAKLVNIAQPVTPHRRALVHKKNKLSEHMTTYNSLATEFADMVGIDPWLITTPFALETHVNFDERSGVEKVAQATQDLLIVLSEKYHKYTINQSPLIQVRNNSGTYGMGRLLVRSPKELSKLYLKKRKKRTAPKGQSVINDVIVQEDIPAKPLFDKFVGETVIYLIGNEILGGFIKSYETLIPTKSLKKARTQLFQPIKFSSGGSHLKLKSKVDKNMGLLYQSVSRLGALAISYDIDKKI